MHMLRNIIAFLSLAAASTAAVADTHPSRQRGFMADSVYQGGDVDHVNVFSGALGISIPLGSSPVTTRFGYGFTVVYNITRVGRLHEDASRGDRHRWRREPSHQQTRNDDE